MSELLHPLQATPLRESTGSGAPWRSGVYPAMIFVALLSMAAPSASLPMSSAAATSPAQARVHQGAPVAEAAIGLPSFSLVAALLPRPASVPVRAVAASATTTAPATHQARATTTPPPSYVPTGASDAPDTTGQPCHGSALFVAPLTSWSVAPGCYGLIYTPNPADYAARAGFGYCDWWPLVLHPAEPDLIYGREYHRGSVPVPGAVVHEAGGVQGASAAGHYAQVVAVAQGGYWMLITEMNFSWRGGGFGKVDYRYIHVGAGITFIYA